MKVVILDDFLDDENLITFKQRKAYIDNNKYLESSYKKAIQKSFERYYEHFKWLRKKKNEPMKFELGKKREIPIVNDRRSLRITQSTEIAKNAIFQLVSEINSKNLKSDSNFAIKYNIGEDLNSLTLTPLNWFVESGLISREFRDFSKKFYDVNEGKTEEYWIAKYYVDLKKRVIRNEFRKIESRLPFKKIPVLVIDRKSELMSKQDILRFEEYLSLLENDPDCEKPRPFHKGNEMTKRYKERIEAYLLERFQTKHMYYAFQLGLSSYDYNELSETDIVNFRENIKSKTDKAIIKRQFKESIVSHAALRLVREEPEAILIPKIINSLRECENSQLKNALCNRTVASHFFKLDRINLFGEVEKDNLDLYLREEFNFHQNVDDYYKKLEREVHGSNQLKIDLEALF